MKTTTQPEGSAFPPFPPVQCAPAQEPIERPILPRRQSAVADLAARGRCDCEIGVALEISENTVGAYLKHIFKRYGVHKRTALARVLLSTEQAQKSDPVADDERLIRDLWAQAAEGAAQTLELARAVSELRKCLPHGDWTKLCTSKRLPFSKRTAAMLVVIGDRLGWANVQSNAQPNAHLPHGWSILYQLAQLDSATLQDLIREGAVHPGLRLREAKDLVARFKWRDWGA